MSAILVTSTAPSQEVASKIANQLVSKKLAACINIFPIQSVYEWKGSVETEPELKLLIKSTAKQFDAISAEIKEHHPYEVPEILRLDIVDGDRAYLDWLTSTVSS